MEFKRIKLANRKGSSSKIGSIDVAPKMLVRVFGKPELGDDYTVSGEYLFEGESGIQISLYDWKCTSLYFPGEDYPSPRKFWADKTPWEFSIGGANKEYAALFIEWLLRQL